MNGSPAKKGGKKAAAAGADEGAKKAKAAAGAVKKTVSKAKTNVVKAGRKKLNKAAKEEVDNLLDKTANGSPEVTETVTPEAEATPAPATATETVILTPSASAKAVAAAATKTKKIKSMVSLNSYNKMEEEPATPVRQSKRISARAAAAAAEAVGEDPVAAAAAVNAEPEPTNGHSDVAMADISVAEEEEEAAEEKTEAAGPGFLKKTISRIWGSGSTNGAGYQEVNETTAAAHTNGDAPPANKGCVIS